MRSIKNVFSFFERFIKNIDKYIKYQIITKLILAIIIIPIYGLLTNYLVNRNEGAVFTNGDIFKFLLSPEGVLFSVFLFLIIIIEVIIEIGGYVLISSRDRYGCTESSYLEILKYNIKLLPKMISIGGIFLVIYLGIMTPMTGFGIRLSFFKGLTIPNFVLEVIDQNTVYSIIYFSILALLLYLGIKFIFTFNFMIIYKISPLRSMQASFKLVSMNRMKILKTLALIFITTALISVVALFIWVVLVEMSIINLNLNNVKQRIVVVFLLKIQTIGVIVVSFMSSPFRCYCITELFYNILDEDSLCNVLDKNSYNYIKSSNVGMCPNIRVKDRASIMDRIFSHKRFLVVLSIFFLFLYSTVISIFAQEFLGYNKNIAVFGHRGYGYFEPENSISAIKRSIKENLDYIEIDVQRTKDRRYVLNHDKTFKRVSSNKLGYINKKVDELDYNQVRKIDIGKKYGIEGERVPTIEEVLDICKDRIKINLELKENTDKRMIDDIMKLISKKGMKKDVIITSLNYKELNYIEEHDPSFQTGLIYYIKLGRYNRYKFDYMIMEESEATKKNIQRLHRLGKKVIIWTVNSREMMDKYSKMPIYGVITDYPKSVKEKIRENGNTGINDLIISEFLSIIEN